MFTITESQKKILEIFLAVETNSVAGTKGLTGYDVRKKRIPGRTWDINRDKLLYHQLIQLESEEKTGKQIRKRYKLTPIGFFTIIKSLNENEIKEKFYKQFGKFIPLIGKNWLELLGIFDQSLYIILGDSLKQISFSVKHGRTELNEEGITHHLGRKIIEETILPFESEKLKLLIFKEYSPMKKAKQVEVTTKSARVVIPKRFDEIDFDEIQNNIINRLTFVFYYNLLRLQKNDLALMNIAERMWYSQPSKQIDSWEEQLKEDFFKTKSDRWEWKFIKKLKGASKQTLKIVNKDIELNKLLKQNLREISSKFKEPSSIDFLIKNF